MSKPAAITVCSQCGADCEDDGEYPALCDPCLKFVCEIQAEASGPEPA